jgi:hypothetical protein
MVAQPRSHYILGSGVGGAAFQSGALHLIDARAMKAEKIALELSPSQVPEAPYQARPSPPEASLFSAHGLSLRPSAHGTYELFVVNHGGRESVEVFRVTPTRSEPVLDWVGCILAPPLAHSLNAVAAGKSGRLVLSATAANGRGSLEQMLADENTGAVYTWDAAAGWSELADSALPANNGIALSNDENGVFVAAWADASVTYFPLTADAGPRRKLALDFYPDNIRRTFDGRLAVTGQAASLLEVATCVGANDPHCAIDYRSALINPATFKVTDLYDGEGTEDFGLATVTLIAEHALWTGSARTRCVARVPVGAH